MRLWVRVVRRVGTGFTANGASGTTVTFDGVAATGIGHQLGVHAGDAAGQRHRFRTGVQAQELVVGAGAGDVADFGADRAVEAQLREARRHDVGHHLRSGHRLEHRRRCVAKAEHAVAAGVVQHRALERDQPGATRNKRHVGVGCVHGVEVQKAALNGLNLRIFVEVEQVGELIPDARVLDTRRTESRCQVRVCRRKRLDRGIVQANGSSAAEANAKRSESVQMWHVGSIAARMVN